MENEFENHDSSEGGSRRGPVMKSLSRCGTEKTYESCDGYGDYVEHDDDYEGERLI
jgi:hypothetical protein